MVRMGDLPRRSSNAAAGFLGEASRLLCVFALILCNVRFPFWVRPPSCAAMAPAGDEPLQFSDFPTETIRGTAGFVRVGRERTGSWWLLGADDRPFFACGVQLGPEPVRFDPAQAAGWGVNTLVVADGGPPAGWAGAWVAAVRFRPAPPEAMIRLQGVQLPDVFDPGWARSCQVQAAAVCPAGVGDPRLVGWMAGADLQWPQLAGGPPRPGLLQICLSLEPRFAAYHAAWEFVLAAHGGELAALAAAWGAELPNRESLRLLTHEDQALRGAGYRLDDDRFTKEFARLYFATVTAAIRAQDPAHLLIGVIPAGGPAPVPEGVAPLVDLLAVEPGAVVAGPQLDTWSRGAALPLFLPGYSWAGLGPEAMPGRTPLEHMLARGRAGLGAVCRHPAAVGYAWRDWCDLPGDRPPFGHGLVRVDGGSAREHTDLLTEMNLGAPARHRASHP
jgi:hypothetical protein